MKAATKWDTYALRAPKRSHSDLEGPGKLGEGLIGREVLVFRAHSGRSAYAKQRARVLAVGPTRATVEMMDGDKKTCRVNLDTLGWPPGDGPIPEGAEAT